MSRTIKVGVFLVAGVALFCVGLFLIGSRKHLFGDYFTAYTQFTDVDTLQSGAKVRVSGMDAGEVSDIEVPKNAAGRFRLKLKIEKSLRPIVREDSVATIETEGMVGNKYVNIKQGSEHSPPCSAGCTLRSQEPVSMDAMMREGSNLASSMQSTIDDLHHRADSAMQNITSLTGHADRLIQGVSPNIEKMTSNSDAIVAGIRAGHGAAGKLLTDKKVASNVEATIANAKQASGNVNTITSDIQRKDLPDVHQTLQNTQSMSHQLNQAVGTFLGPNNNQGTAVALHDAAQSAKKTTANLADDTAAIKHNFLLRGFFKRRGFYDLETLTPDKYAATEFVKKPRARIWIPAAGLFDVRPDGSQQLSKIGQSIVDQYMSELVPYLPNNPMVVEGYSTSGMPDQRYLASRQRAMEVRQYLESRFHLDPKRVGIMPFGDHPPVDRQVWDGVCLVLVVSKQ